MQRKFVKSLLYSAGVVLATISLLAVMKAFSKKSAPVEQRERIYLVQAIKANIGNLRPKLSVFGTIEARNRVELTSPVVAEVLATPFLEGTSFGKGDRLVELDLRDLQLRRTESLASAEEVNAQILGIDTESKIERERLEEVAELLNLSRSQFERSERLYAQKVIPQSQLETAQVRLKETEIDHLGGRQRVQSLETQRLRLQAQKKRIDSQRGQLDILFGQAQVRAPFAGTVLDIDVSVGDRVSAGTPLIEIFDPNSLAVRASIPNSYLNQVVRAHNPEVILEDPDGQAITLNVDYLKPEIRENQGSAEAIIKLPNRNWILGSVTNINVILDGVPGSVALPFEALYGNNRVFRIDKDLRAQGISCKQVGLANIVDGNSHALLKCDSLEQGDLVISQQIPNLATGFKLEVVK